MAQASLSLKALMTKEKVLRERLHRFVIKAPPGWRVMARSVEPGAWGVVWDGQTVFPEAVDCCQRLVDAGKDVLFLSNVAELTIEDLARRMRASFARSDWYGVACVVAAFGSRPPA